MPSNDRTGFSDVEFWDRLVQSGPAEALTRARALVDGGGLSSEEVALAHTAIARSLFETGHLHEALAAARQALEGSSDAPTQFRSAVAMSASVILAEAGFVDEALASLEDLRRGSHGVALGRIRMQTAYVLHHSGRLNEALEELDLSEELLARGGEERDRLRVHHNRGLVLLQQGRLREAESDFERAGAMAEAAGMVAAQALSVANRAVLHGRARRLAESLRLFDEAAALFEVAGNPARTVALMEIDRAEVMMHSGLPIDAIDASRVALERIEPTGNRVMLGDAHLMMARAELAAGHARRATNSAERAEQLFGSSGRHDMTAHASAVRVKAALTGARTDVDAKSALADASVIVASLRRGGWESGADDLALDRIRSGFRWRLLSEISDDVERLRLGTQDGQRHTALSGWYAEAIARFTAGDTQSAVDACLIGLESLDDIVAEAASLEQRSAAMQLGHDVSQLTIELAVVQRDADTALAAAEGTRARALHEELAGRERHQPLTEVGAERLRRELASRLGTRTLVEWIVANDRVWAVVFDSTGSRLVEIGDRCDIVRARDRLLVWLDLAAAEPDESSARAMRAASLLDDMIIRPLRLPPGTGVVVVPDDLLHGVPWCGLPSFADRPLSLAPNAQVWLEADRRAPGATRSLGFVVGPGVDGSDAERVAIDRWHPAAAVASGAGATAATVRSMFSGSDVVHVAAHGLFRSDHPLLSTLRLHDGEATLYDAVPDRVRSKLVILSSCEGGAQGASDGSEVLGLSAVLLARGAAAVLAPLTVVRDLECAEFVAEVHAELGAGEPFACAVANVRQRWLADDDLSRWAVASSFTCFGSGTVVLAG